MRIIELQITFGKRALLKGFLGSLEKLLKKEEEDLSKRIEVESKKLTKEEREDDLEYYAEELHYVKTEYRTVLRQSFVLACCSCLERDLTDFCDYIQETKKLPIKFKMYRGKGAGIKKFKEYLEKEANFKFPTDATWNEVLSIYDIRNCIAHNNGRLGYDARRDNRIQGYIKKRSNLLSLDENAILLSKEYCEHALNTMDEFFEALFSRLS